MAAHDLESELHLLSRRRKARRHSAESERGVVVQDHFKPYNGLVEVYHAFCNAHILREFEAAIELGCGRSRPGHSRRYRLGKGGNRRFCGRWPGRSECGAEQRCGPEQNPVEHENKASAAANNAKPVRSWKMPSISPIYPDSLKSREKACVWRKAGFGWSHDSRRLSQ